MSRSLTVLQAGPGVTVQDLGRFGYLSKGVGPSGAADRDAVFEGAALLNQSTGHAVIEMAGLGGAFQFSAETRIALTGAEMPARIDDQPLSWNASYLVHPNGILHLGPARTGNYGYLHIGGGIGVPEFLGSRSTHTIARIGHILSSGSELPLQDDTGEVGNQLKPTDRFGGGVIRVIPSVQTKHFAAKELQRFENTQFSRDARGNRMGAAMAFDGAPFKANSQLNLVSETVVLGDIQIAGDGTPFVLLGECQTTGGYPRIGTVIPPDIPKIAQARAGEALSFKFIDKAGALAAYAAHEAQLASIKTTPMLRSPQDISDLLSYQLIDGMVNALKPETGA